MLEFASFLSDQNRVLAFLLLFVRFSSLLVFLPIFNYSTIPVSIKGAFAFYLTLLFFPLMPATSYNFTVDTFMAVILLEVMLGFLAGFVLQMLFYILHFAGELISFQMGFSMASTIDPQTQSQSPIVGQVFTLIALLILLLIDGHHLMIEFMAKSIQSSPIGTFVLEGDVVKYSIKAMSHLFIMGFTIAFPIIALSLLSDIIFGMIMKTMPQFNLLVVGFPIKISIAFFILTIILPAFVVIFKKEFEILFRALQTLFL